MGHRANRSRRQEKFLISRLRVNLQTLKAVNLAAKPGVNITPWGHGTG